MEFDVKKADAKFLFAKGDEEFKCEMEYKMIAALNMEGKIHIETPLKAMKFMEIEGSLKQKDGELKVKLNIESDLPKFSHVKVDGHFKKSDAAIETMFDASTPFEQLEQIRFKLLVPLSMDNLKSHIKFETTSNKFEMLAAVNDHSKNLQASLKFFWNNKEVVLTCDFLNERNVDLKLKLKTPFADFEKFMIHAKAHKFDLKKMSLVAEFNEKRWEVMGSIAMKEEKMVDFKLKTPLAGHERYEFTLKVDAGNMVATVLLPAKKTSLIVNYEIKGAADVLLYAELEGVLEHPAVFELIHKINKAEHKYYGSAELLYKAKKIVSIKTGGSFKGKAVAIQLDAAALEHTFYMTVDGSVKDVAVTCKSSLFKKDFIYQAEWAVMKGKKVFFLNHFIQIPLKQLGAYTHKVDITKEKLADGHKFAVALKGDGTQMFDGEFDFVLFHKTKMTEADCKFKAANFFVKPFSAQYIAKFEEKGDMKVVTVAHPEKFLWEGTYQPLEKGMKTGMKAIVDKKEVVKTSLDIVTDPGFFSLAAAVKPEAEFINVQADFTDILNSKAFVQPKLLKYLTQFFF